MIQVYGRFDGYWSHAQVSRGFALGLQAAGCNFQVLNVAGGTPWVKTRGELEEVRTVATTDVGRLSWTQVRNLYEGLPHQVAVGCNPEARVGLYVGGYPPFARGWLDNHPVKAALFICESEVVPTEWAMLADQCDIVAVPSKFCRDAYTRGGLNPRKMVIVHHGLAPAFSADERRVFSRGSLRFCHVCGAGSFPWRKGLPELLQAFPQVFTPDEATLVVRAPRMLQDMVESAGLNVTFDTTVDPDTAMSPSRMRNWLLKFDVNVQPSRTEAFGMVPLEARALGLHVALTEGTGHLEHLQASDERIPVGPTIPMRVNGIENGFGPDVTVEAIALALRNVARKARNGPPVLGAGYCQHWAWENVTKKFCERLRELDQGGATLEDKLGV